MQYYNIVQYLNKNFNLHTFLSLHDIYDALAELDSIADSDKELRKKHRRNRLAGKHNDDHLDDETSGSNADAVNLSDRQIFGIF